MLSIIVLFSDMLKRLFKCTNRPQSHILLLDALSGASGNILRSRWYDIKVHVYAINLRVLNAVLLQMILKITWQCITRDNQLNITHGFKDATEDTVLRLNLLPKLFAGNEETFVAIYALKNMTKHITPMFSGKRG